MIIGSYFEVIIIKPITTKSWIVVTMNLLHVIDRYITPAILSHDFVAQYFATNMLFVTLMISLLQAV